MLCSWARHFTLSVPLSTQEYKWVPATKCWGVTCDGLASHSEGVAIVASCYRNWDKFWQLWATRLVKTLPLCTCRVTCTYSSVPLLSLSGNRTSVASSTDTEHDTDIDDPTPLPPPRPRHWARRAKEQSMVPESNSFNSGKIAEEESKADDPSSPSDWSKSVPQFPLLTLKPTCMQSKWYRCTC